VASLPELLKASPAELRALKAQLLAERSEKQLAETKNNAEAIRSRCHDSFAAFVREAWPIIEPGTPLRWNWHLDAMCAHLQAITEGRLTPWLIINVPPGSSKSTIVSVLWQAWEWGPRGLRHLRYVSTSFEMDNVKRDTRKSRDLIRSEWYRALWPEVAMARAGETSFANTDTGSREGVAFASITGKRGDRVVIDDPHSLKGAESETQRNATIRTFMEGGLNRTNDALTSSIVVVMQRLHESDLTGALLAADLGFIHLMIPMEFEVARRCTTPLIVDGLDEKGAKVTKNWTDPRSYEGQLMDPVRFPREAVARQQKAGEYAWAGQYQQRPAPREGGLFKIPEGWALPASEGGMIVETVPEGCETVGGWDFAGSKRKKSPYSVRVKLSRARDGTLYVRHVARKRTSPAELETMVVDVAVEDGPTVRQDMPQDPGQAGKAQKWRLAELLEGFDFRITPETGDKETRALPFAAQFEAGRVFLVRGDWNAAYIEELRNFPTGTYKDQVDGSSRAYASIIAKGSTVETPGPEVIDLSKPSADDPRERLRARTSPRAARAAQVDAWGA
jgi:predicted phage terminase large subunit-like protein